MSKADIQGLLSQVIEGLTEHEVDMSPEMYKAIHGPLSSLEATLQGYQDDMKAHLKRFEALEVLGNSRVDFTRTSIEDLKGALEDPAFRTEGWMLRIDVKRANVSVTPTEAPAIPDLARATMGRARYRVRREVFEQLIGLHNPVLLQELLEVHPHGERSAVATNRYIETIQEQRRVATAARRFQINPVADGDAE